GGAVCLELALGFLAVQPPDMRNADVALEQVLAPVRARRNILERDPILLEHMRATLRALGLVKETPCVPLPAGHLLHAIIPDQGVVTVDRGRKAEQPPETAAFLERIGQVGDRPEAAARKMHEPGLVEIDALLVLAPDDEPFVGPLEAELGFFLPGREDVRADVQIAAMDRIELVVAHELPVALERPDVHEPAPFPGLEL